MQHVIVNANYFDGYVSMMQINQFQFQVQSDLCTYAGYFTVGHRRLTIENDVRLRYGELIKLLRVQFGDANCILYLRSRSFV